MATTTVGGVRLHHDVTGDGPPLLLLAGLGLNSLAWVGVLAPPAQAPHGDHRRQPRHRTQ